MQNMISSQVLELQAKSKPLPQAIQDGQMPGTPERDVLVPVMSLMNAQEQEYVRGHIGMIAVEIDGQIHFVQQTAYVPPHPRTQVQKAENGMPAGIPPVAGG